MAESRWQSREVATLFLEGVRGALPQAALQLELVGHIISRWRPAPRAILDLGCGDGAVGRFLLGRFPGSEVFFLDFSDPMLEGARRHLSGVAAATIVKADFSTPGWLSSVQTAGRFDVVVSGFAIHHQPDGRKRELYQEVAGVLSPGGVFLNLEHVASATGAGEELFDAYFIRHLFEFHRRKDPATTLARVEGTYYNRPDKVENKLAPVETQCRWLREIGFADVDCFFKVFELALFGGRLPPAA